MNITSVNNTYYAEFFPSNQGGSSGSAPIAPQDIVNINSLSDMTDEEVEELLQNTIQTIQEDPVGALAVHNGLTPDRVYSLLAQ
ncbi:MAG: hypothetical protein IJS54_00665 [Desulfovibrio sp.]|nr:hypothetical protein [Desulfovibrio sp.]